MTKHLDPKFAKIVALMNSTVHEGEKVAARQRAEAVARSCGMTFDQAMAICSKPAPQPAPFVNIFEGFDDWMEKREPGYKAQRAKEKSDKAAARRARVKILLKRYGSVEAGLAPCKKEKLLHEALRPWIVYAKPPHERWTYSLDGSSRYWLSEFRDMPHILDAVACAYPLPTTLPEALAEFEYWHTRSIELEDLLDDEIGDEVLDRPASLRRDMVEDLLTKDLLLTTVADLYARFKFYRGMDFCSEKIEDAIFRDLESMAKAEANLSNVSTGSLSKGLHKVRPLDDDVSSVDGQMKDAAHIRPALHGQIEEMLKADPAQSDRYIARACICSPTTVGKIRTKLGLAQPVRSVQRRGQMYQMRANRPG